MQHQSHTRNLRRPTAIRISILGPGVRFRRFISSVFGRQQNQGHGKADQISSCLESLLDVENRRCPGADQFAGSELGRTQFARKVSHRDVASQSNHRHADFQFQALSKNISDGVVLSTTNLVSVEKGSENVLPDIRHSRA